MISRLILLGTALLMVSTAKASDSEKALIAAGAATNFVGIHFVTSNLFALSAGTLRSERANARYQSALAYPEYARLQQETLEAEAQVAKLRGGNASRTLIDQADSTRLSLAQKRDEALKLILDRDALRFDPLLEGRRMPADVLRIREQLQRKERLAFDQIRRHARVRGVGAIGLLVSGTIILFSGSEILEAVLTPSEAYDQVSELDRRAIADHIAKMPAPSNLGLEYIFREYR